MRLSPSALNLFLECPKCFYLEYKLGIHRPKGPFPSLPGGMDILIKKHFDRCRLLGQMPSEIAGKVEGRLFPDLEILNKWRNWRSGLVYRDKESGVDLSGALDDCLVAGGRYAPMDYKTRGFDVKDGGELFYQNQMNCYELMLQGQGLPTVGLAWLIYWIPKEIEKGGVVKFVIDVKKMSVDGETALRVLRAAAKTLQGTAPKSHSACTFCSWGSGLIAD